MSFAVLAGIRVLDLSQFLPGPFATQLLADLGADVVKIEPPSGDPMRALGPIDGDGVSAFWKLVNAGKTVLELDLKSAAGKADLEALLARADVLVESYRPGVLARLGFAPERLRAVNPGLVHVALSGYGQTGPWADRSGHDINYMAVAGGLASSGTAERPVTAHPPVADCASAVTAAFAACAALVGRGRTGRGAYVDLSLADTVLAWQGWVLTGALRPGWEPARAGSLLNGGAAYYQIYRAGDGRFVTLGAIEAKFWANFATAMGRPDWIARQGEPFPQTPLIADVAAVFATQPAARWEALLGPADCCFAIVSDPAEVPSHPQVAARRLIDDRSATAEPVVAALFPAWIDGAPPPPRAAAVRDRAAAVLARWAVDGWVRGGGP